MHLPVYGIVGPTASGKTALGQKLVSTNNFGRDFGRDFVIINGDSQQVYSYLPYLSCIPKNLHAHVLYKIIDHPAIEFNVASWAKLAHEAIHQAHNAGKIPIILGGTGLYFNVLQKGLARLQEPSEHVKEFVKTLSLNELLKFVSKKEAQTFKDRRRLEKAASVFLEFNENMDSLQNKSTYEFKIDNFEIYALMPEREIIWKNIESRLHSELNDMIDDVLGFNATYGETDINMIGYKEITSHIKFPDYKHNLDSLKQELFFKTRQYAKRQVTYIKNVLQVKEIFQTSQELFKLFEKKQDNAK